MSAGTTLQDNRTDVGNSTLQLATFRVGDVIFGIDINHVQEINRSLQVTEVPDAPKRFHGVVNLRGDVVTVINPHHVFGIEVPEGIKTRRNLILNIDGERVGVLVDRVMDILEVEQSKLSQKPANADSIDRRYIDSVYVDEDQIVVVIHAEALAADAELQAESTN